MVGIARLPHLPFLPHLPRLSRNCRSVFRSARQGASPPSRVYAWPPAHPGAYGMRAARALDERRPWWTTGGWTTTRSTRSGKNGSARGTTPGGTTRRRPAGRVRTGATTAADPLVSARCQGAPDSRPGGVIRRWAGAGRSGGPAVRLGGGLRIADCRAGGDRRGRVDRQRWHHPPRPARDRARPAAPAGPRRPTSRLRRLPPTRAFPGGPNLTAGSRLQLSRLPPPASAGTALRGAADPRLATCPGCIDRWNSGSLTPVSA